MSLSNPASSLGFGAPAADASAHSSSPSSITTNYDYNRANTDFGGFALSDESQPRRRGRRPRNDLTPQQLMAVDQLALGKSDRVVAEILGVHRVTVAKWKLYHVLFRSELAARREEFWSEDRQRYRELFRQAMDTLQSQVQSKEAAVAHRACRTVLSFSQKLMPRPTPELQCDSLDPQQILIQHARYVQKMNAARDAGEMPVEQYELDQAREDLKMKLNEKEWTPMEDEPEHETENAEQDETGNEAQNEPRPEAQDESGNAHRAAVPAAEDQGASEAAETAARQGREECSRADEGVLSARTAPTTHLAPGEDIGGRAPNPACATPG